MRWNPCYALRVTPRAVSEPQPSAPAPPEYSIVVPAFDEEELLGGTLEALRAAMAQVTRPGEIVVCDNNSRDRTAAVAAASGARVVFEAENQISRARNAGARAAAGRWLVFVDADTRIGGALLARALDALASERVVGGGALVSSPGARGLLAAAIRVWNRVSRTFKLAAGAFVFVRRDAFEAVGGFSEKVYASEEIWLSSAVRRWGRPRGLDFVVLEGAPIETSGRKTEWYAAWRVLALMLLVGCFPFLVRFPFQHSGIRSLEFT